jgi:hypothetical protein
VAAKRLQFPAIKNIPDKKNYFSGNFEHEWVTLESHALIKLFLCVDDGAMN